MTAPASQATAGAMGTARRLQQQLIEWLRHRAYPIWSTAGVDALSGGFQERLSQDGTPLAEPRRARVQPRQIYAFARAPHLGWRGDARAIVERGIAFYLSHYRRPDGLYRTLVAADGSTLDNSVLLYDQAFALLGLASARRLLGPDPALEEAGGALIDALYSQLKRVGPGFYSGLPARFPLLSNPHMHLLESALAWGEISSEPVWRTLAGDLGALALTRLIDSHSGIVRETFDETWAPAPGLEGRRIEPGHQFEWAWLLLRWRPDNDSPARRAALRLIEIGEQSGVHNGLAIDALLDDLSVHEGGARLWPQTERLKAASLAAVLTGDARHWVSAAAAAQGLLRYLTTPVAGLWYDSIGADGSLHPAPAPASSFYHLIAAIEALTDALAEAEAAGTPPPESSPSRASRA
jgi:mannose/cellobiose epimerase-like protein (N-acyl-D-glucosamine 2-epimerase family)